jgi:hypothetical protein
MLVLVATAETQGLSPDDFAYTVAGELVTAVATECQNPDCGCDRGFPVLASARATTTAQVVELPHVTEDDLRAALLDYFTRGGWLDLLADEPDLDMIIEDMIDEHLEAIVLICSRCPVGTIVERAGSRVFTRSVPFAA